MPYYDYRCRYCGTEWTESRSVDMRHAVSCNCGAKPEIVIGRVAVHNFKPGYSYQLGRYIRSRSHKDEVCKELGVTCLGDADYDTVEKEAQSNRDSLERQKKEARKRKFCEDVLPKYPYIKHRNEYREYERRFDDDAD